MSVPQSILEALRRFARRATADYAFRIRHLNGLFEIHERSGGAWRVRGLFSTYDDAEHVADALVRERSRASRPRRRLGAASPCADGAIRHPLEPRANR